MKRFMLLVAVLSLAVLGVVQHAAAAEAWVIDDFAIDATVRPDGTLVVTEQIQVDFRREAHHGIYRDLYYKVPCVQPKNDATPTPVVPCPKNHDRVYAIRFSAVTDANGRPITYEVTDEGDYLRAKIGDANRTVTGKQTYVIQYQIAGLLDGYSDHDELYWNATGTWPVGITRATVLVHLPEGTRVVGDCFEGGQGSLTPCTMEVDGSDIRYTTSSSLFAGEQLTVRAGFPQGVVALQPPKFEKRTTIADFFELDWIEFGGMGVVGLLSAAGVGMLWWRNGRDRRFKTLHYLTNDPGEHIAPLFEHHDIVVEFLPPDDLRPGEMGVILDERADTRDISATIIDLAVRGYLHITEIPKEGWFGKKDWQLTRVDRESDLKQYERTLYDALFASGGEVKISSLKNKFAEKLSKVKGDLYDDAMSRKWFSARPETARTLWLLAGFGLIAIGVGLAVAGGYLFGRSLIFAPVALAGLVMLPLSRAMARRTAAGSEALRRVLGFRLYITTAETRIQDFNEQQNILDKFARYLPYAIVFDCVDKWANAFKGLEDQAEASTSGWYSGAGAFQVAAFSSGLQGFSSSMSSTMSSTPGSSGGGGGGAGGGGGGGGGGAW